MLGKVDGCQIIHQITKSCCRAVPDDRFEVQNNPTCMNIGFSISALSREDRIWRKGTTKFSCSRLAVDISRCRASCCAEQPPVSMRGSVQRYRARKKGCYLDRKRESICTYIHTNFVFRRNIYLRALRANT